MARPNFARLVTLTALVFATGAVGGCTIGPKQDDPDRAGDAAGGHGDDAGFSIDSSTSTTPGGGGDDASTGLADTGTTVAPSAPCGDGGSDGSVDGETGGDSGCVAADGGADALGETGDAGGSGDAVASDADSSATDALSEGG